ncbi:unnamed protein product [Euphydryas editha]|uniref:Reverse transcriptase domain-containing protein n=1 Tax=Euphydryas editha TaxID=104508 RepID=A0AAU9UY86_EUPED|nr:unnamed protein product [Euphydryas editha]
MVSISISHLHLPLISKLNPILLQFLKFAQPDIPLFIFSLVDGTEIQKHLLFQTSAITSKASFCDGISRIMLMFIGNTILASMTYIINTYLTLGSYPNEWRRAFILPLPNIQNSSLLPPHYRPIFILLFLSKIIESVVHRQLSSFLTKYDLLDPLQSGFRAGNSTSTALLKITEDIRVREAMENKSVSVFVLIDFSNAFNVVDHDLLLALLTHYSISAPRGSRFALSWFSSYLRGHTQVIRIDEGNSDWCDVVAGVPQDGYIISFIIFSFY